MGQNFAFSMLKSTPARKKNPTAGCVVGTNISYVSYDEKEIQIQIQIYAGYTLIHYLTRKLCKTLTPFPYCLTQSQNAYFEEIKLTISFSDSNKIVHLKDVFQNQHEIVLVLEYAPGRCLFLILVFK